jgi:hypothetical protein
MNDKLENLLPDFGEILDLVDEIKEVEFKRVLLELDIKNEVANIYREVIEQEKYYINGKPPSAVYIGKTFEQTGIDNELIEARKNLAVLNVTSNSKINRLQIYKKMVEVWRTLSANERNINI